MQPKTINPTIDLLQNTFELDLNIGDVIHYSDTADISTYPKKGILLNAEGNYVKIKIETSSQPISIHLFQIDGVL